MVKERTYMYNPESVNVLMMIKKREREQKNKKSKKRKKRRGFQRLTCSLLVARTSLEYLHMRKSVNLKRMCLSWRLPVQPVHGQHFKRRAVFNEFGEVSNSQKAFL